MTISGKKNPVCNNYTIANSNIGSIYNTNSSPLVQTVFFFNYYSLILTKMQKTLNNRPTSISMSEEAEK